MDSSLWYKISLSWRSCFVQRDLPVLLRGEGRNVFHFSWGPRLYKCTLENGRRMIRCRDTLRGLSSQPPGAFAVNVLCFSQHCFCLSKCSPGISLPSWSLPAAFDCPGVPVGGSPRAEDITVRRTRTHHLCLISALCLHRYWNNNNNKKEGPGTSCSSLWETWCPWKY